MKKLLSLLMATLLTLSLAACGGTAEGSSKPAGGSTAASTPSTTPPAGDVAQGVTDTSVKVANSAAVSGAYAPVGVPFNMGINAYFKMVNDAGGVNGRKIEFIHKDDEFSPEKGKAAFEEFLDDDKVFAIVGHFGTPVVAATLSDMKAAGIPTVYYATGIAQLSQDKAEGKDRSSLPIQPIYTTEGEVMVAYALGHFKAKKIGVIYTNDDAGKSLYTGIEKAAKENGVELAVETIQAGATDATAQVSKVKDCDIILGAMIQATLPVVLKEMEKQDVMKPILTTYVNVSATITETNAEHIQKLMHTEEAGIYGLGWVEPDTTTEEYKNFEKYMREVGATDADLNTYAMTGWIAGSVFVQGLKRVGSNTLSWENYIDAMESAPIQNPFGGQVDFANGVRHGTTAMNLSRMDDTIPVGWKTIIPITSIQDILAG